jgi:CHAT domain-containing protein
MRCEFSSVTIAAVICVLLPTGIAAAQTGGAAFQSRDWRGQPIDYVCKASPGDAEGLRQALIRQELFRIGSDTKAETGWYYGDRLRTARLKTREATATQIVERIKQRLHTDADTVRTTVLIYDVGVRRGKSMLCVWLLTAEGIAAAETVPVTNSVHVQLGGFAENARNVLGVTRTTLARAPLPRSHAASAPIPAADRQPIAAGGDNLNVISELLLPTSVRRALDASRSERLLVLPAADFSTVPFAALSINGRALIDISSIVILTGIDELVNPLKRDVWSRRFSDPALSLLIVADPDASTDELRWAQLPGAREEAKFVASLLQKMPGETLLGPDATTDAVRQALRARNLGLIYFATHGIADASDPLVRSFLLLSGGRLHVKEIATQRHERAPLVIMSACQSGLGKTFEGGTFGLARGWLAAGASQVVTSLWDIGDETTKELMADFITRMVNENVRPEVALRDAMLAARDQRKVSAAIWAGFAFLGFASE